MTGVYERALGEAAGDLHPKVRERYAMDSSDNAVGVGRGEMDVARGTHVLPALYAMPTLNLLFPEAGHGVPFSVRTAGVRTRGDHDALATVRTFAFENARRRFDSHTVWDSRQKRLLDFLGIGGLLVSELHPRAEAGALVVASGRQWLRLAGRYVELPDAFAARVEVRDRYDETGERYHVAAVIENPLAGHVMSYRGTFTQTTESSGGVSDGMRPVRAIGRLPPA